MRESDKAKIVCVQEDIDDKGGLAIGHVIGRRCVASTGAEDGAG